MGWAKTQQVAGDAAGLVRDLEEPIIPNLVWLCLTKGVGIMFSTTMKGDALVVTTFMDGEQEKAYMRDLEEMTDSLSALADWLEALPDLASKAKPANGKRRK